jgi:lipoprotein-anchoring transpeptidase ErfK/SrfK
MGFNLDGYGIHGTIHPDMIGQPVSAGCVRMLNNDVEELFDIVPEGTRVLIN